MAASTFMPDVTVEIAFDSGYTTPAASRTWTDVSAYVEAQFPISISRGRSDELSDVSPSTCTVTFDNKDGRFTPENAAGAYYPNVKKGRPIRVTAVWVLGGGGTTYRRFTGYVDEWPVQWPDNTAAIAMVPVTATSRMARLGRTAEMKSVVETDVLADSPVIYYTLGDEAGSTRASNTSVYTTFPAVVQQIGSGGTATFGNAIGPGTDSLSALELTRADSRNGKILQTRQFDTAITSDAAGYAALEFWFVSTMTDGILAALVNTTVTVGGHVAWIIGIDGGNLQVFRVASGSTNLAPYLAGTSVNDGLLHHAVLRIVDNGAAFDTELYQDGVLVGTGAASAGALDNLGAAAGRLYIGGIPSTLTDASDDIIGTGTIAHVAVYNTDVGAARWASHYESGTTGFEGESSDERIERLGAYALIPSVEISTEAGNTTSMTMQDSSGKAPVDVMLDTTHTENGLLFDAGDGTLTFHARGHRFNATSSLTLNVTTQEVEGDLEPKLDDQGVVNDVSVNNTTSTVHIVNDTSIDDLGFYRSTSELFTTSDSEVEDFANYQVSIYGEPRVRVPSCSVQLMGKSSAQITALLALELGDLITITNLPTQAPASTMTFFVEGISEAIGFESWLMSLNLSPGDIPGDLWTLGVSLLGTDTALAY